MTWLAVAKPVHMLLPFMGGVYFTALYGPAKCVEAEIDGWFSWVKYPSMMVVWWGLLAASARPGSQCVAIFSQWIIGVNMLEAGLLGITDADFVSGLVLVALSPFAPGAVVDAQGNIRVSDKASILGCRCWKNPMEPTWFFRLHYIVLGAYYFVGSFWESGKSVKIHLTLTCVLPLLWTTLVDRRKTQIYRIFLVRTFGLLVMVIDLTVNDEFNHLTSYGTDFAMSTVWRNVAQAVIILTLVASCLMLDRLEVSMFEEGKSAPDLRSALLLRFPSTALLLGLSQETFVMQQAVEKPATLQQSDSPSRPRGQEDEGEFDNVTV